VLPAQNRMTRSAEFAATVKYGVRAAQPDIVVHARRDTGHAPRIGFVVTKAVGGAVERNRVARRLRHAARTVVSDLQTGDLVVVRALPGSRHALTERLRDELRTALGRARELMERER